MYVYKIENKINGKVYIGLSRSESNRRLSTHRYLLNKNIHSNEHLQSAWNKYGSSNFIFEKISFEKSIESLQKRERELIREYNAVDRKFGYNVFEGGETHSVPQSVRDKIGNANRGNLHSMEQRTKWAIEKRINEYPDIVSPEGDTSIITNLRKFCKDNSLDRRNLTKVLKRKAYQYSGWHLKDTPQEALTDVVKYSSFKQRTLKYKDIISLDGEIYIIDVMARFCREHNLNPQHIRAVMKGERNHHKGWKVV